MPAIQDVVVLGAGAMGAYFVERFLDTQGIEVAVVARGERGALLAREGLVVNDRHLAVPVLHPDEAAAPVDLIIVALKHHHLPQAVPDLRHLVSDQTIIISVMNGLDSETYIGAIYGLDKMLYTVSVGIDAVRQGNRIVYSQPGKQLFGEATNDTITSRVQRVQVAFDQAGIFYETPPDMIRMLWWKFMVNVGMNQSSAVMRAPYGIFQTTPQAQALMEALMTEVLLLAQAEGVNLTRADIDDWYRVLHTLSPRGQTSMLQDVIAGRKTEVEVFGAKVVELGRKHDIPTPVNNTVLQILQVVEQRQRR
jgi:2-dehydropantoate 2-reductase